MRLPVVEPTWADRAIAYIDPIRAVHRRRARMALAMSGAYTGARRDRRATQEWVTSSGSADADLIPDLPTLRERSRDLERNDPLAGGAINTVVTEAVGTGLHPRPQVDRAFLGLDDAAAEAWQAAALREWWLFADSQECDITRTQKFVEMQDLVLRSTLTSGDIFAVRRFRERPGSPYGLKIQLVEGDRISNPHDRRDFMRLDDGGRLVGGVQTDVDGAPVAYYVQKQHPGDMYGGRSALREWQRVDAFDAGGDRLMLHCFDRLRPEQNRGVPYLAPVVEPLKQLGRYTTSELEAAVVASFFTVFIKSETGGGLGPVEPVAETGAKTSDKDFKLAPAAMFDLLPGESIETADPTRPNTAFEPFVTAVYRQIGVRLELPYEVLIKHFSSSYSASRAALLQAWKFLRRRRQWVADYFCQPVYGWLITEAVMRGRLTAPGFLRDPLIRAAWLGSEWIGPPPGTIDPEAEVAAAAERIEIGISSIDRETTEMTGSDFETVHTQRVKEKRMRSAAGLETEAPVSAQPAPPEGERKSPMRREREAALAT